jgi:hypothetical protein
LGTIQPKTIVKVIYAPDDRRAWDYRLHFYDRKDEFYRLKIVDLSWHYYCDSLRGEGTEPAAVAEKLTEIMQKRKVYLRIGLALGWKEFPDRCYLQITGVYTLPDYLNGNTFLDFRHRKVRESLAGYAVNTPGEEELALAMDNDLRDDQLK